MMPGQMPSDNEQSIIGRQSQRLDAKQSEIASLRKTIDRLVAENAQLCEERRDKEGRRVFNVGALSFRDECAIVMLPRCMDHAVTLAGSGLSKLSPAELKEALSRDAFTWADAMEAERKKRIK